MTARSHETIRVGLRRIIRDPNVKVNVRLRAIEMLMGVEGLKVNAAIYPATNNLRPIIRTSEANSNKLRELLCSGAGKRSRVGLPGA